jgi:FkbM family methyltransferase
MLNDLNRRLRPRNRLLNLKNAFVNLGLRGFFVYVYQRLRLLWPREQHVIALRSKYALHPVQCRTKSSDVSVFWQIFISREYSCLDDVASADLIIDCGANIGCSAAYFLTGYPHCKLIAVEPDPKNFEMLSRNLAPYGDRAKLLHAAVWSHPARLTFAETPYRDGSGWSRQVRECLADEEEAGFAAVGIGDLLKQSGRSRISILKIDIEGAEAVVFSKNYESWIDQVDTLVIELHDDTMFGDCSSVFEKAIAGRGFTKSHCEELTVCKRRIE